MIEYYPTQRNLMENGIWEWGVQPFVHVNEDH
ncbi:unnamed protein product, partial [marine sediment metagenome]